MIPETVFQTEAWRHIAAYLLAEIQALHRRNAGDLSDTDTARTRGELRFAQRLLDLSVAKKHIAPAPVDEYLT